MIGSYAIKRIYNKELWGNVMVNYLDHEALKEGDVYLSDTLTGTRVISKIVEIEAWEATVVDLAGDVIRGDAKQGSLKESEYLKYLDRLRAIKILFNHNVDWVDHDPVKVTEKYFSEYLL